MRLSKRLLMGNGMMILQELVYKGPVYKYVEINGEANFIT